MNATKTIRRSPCMGAARVPAAGSAGAAVADGVDRTRQLDADTFAQYIGPTAKPTPGLGAAVPQLADRGLADPFFAAGAMLVTAILGCVPAAVDFYTLQLRGEPFLPWDLMQVSEAAGVASAAGIHIQTSMTVSIVLCAAGRWARSSSTGSGQSWLASAGGRLCRQRGSRLRAGVLRLSAARRDGESLASCRTPGCRTVITATMASSPAF